MSNVVSALNGKAYTGVVSVKDAGLHGMITLRGDFMDENVGAAVQRFVGVDLPDALQASVGEDGRAALWMSPDEVLLLVPYEQAATLATEMTQAFGDTHALAANVSDARAVFELSGPFAAEVLAKVAPIDMASSAFMPGMVRRTRIAQVPAAFWISGEDTFTIVCFRSVADYVFEVLETSAKAGAVGALK